jgi:hypothetical protein
MRDTFILNPITGPVAPQFGAATSLWLDIGARRRNNRWPAR